MKTRGHNMNTTSIIEEIYENSRYHNVLDLKSIAEIKALRTTLVISRGRRVSLSNAELYKVVKEYDEDLDKDVDVVKPNIKEGLTMFYLDPEEGVYIPYQLQSGLSIWPRIKGRCLTGVDIKITQGNILEPVLDPNSDEYLMIMRALFGIEDNVSAYSFQLKATPEAKVVKERNVFDSATVESAVTLPTPLTRLTEDEQYEYARRDRFLAYVYSKGGQLTIVDLGMLIDDSELNLRDMEELLTIGKTNPRSRYVHTIQPTTAKQHADAINGQDNFSKRILLEWMAERTGKNLKIVDNLYVPPDKPWREFTEDDVTAFLKDKNFEYQKELSNGSFVVICKSIKGYALYVGITSDTDFIRSVSWHFDDLETAKQECFKITQASDEPSRGKRIQLPV